MSDLLPPNATPQERALSSTIARVSDIPVPLRDLWRPDTCPEPLLPWLAWALSVETWNPAWPVETKRGVIATASEVARRKGTVGAVRRAIEAIGGGLVLKEWWQTSPQGTPHTFSVDVVVNDARTNLSLYSQDFNHASWIKFNTTIGTIRGEAPDGSTSAQRLNEVAVVPAASHACTSGDRPVLPERRYVWSLYVKAAERGRCALGLTITGNLYRWTTFDLRNKVVVRSDAGNVGGIEEVPGRPGWLRIWTSRASDAGQTLMRSRVATVGDDAFTTAIEGTTGAGIWIWGAQLEQGNAPTNYIRTTTATVTKTDVQDAVVAEINRTKPVRSHFTVNYGTSAEGAVNLCGVAQTAVFARLNFRTTF